MQALRCVMAVALVLVAGQAAASVVVARTVEELSRRTAVVVRGTVGAQEARWDPSGRTIATYTQLQVAEVLKGRAAATVTVRQPGGEVGKVGQRVAGAARFRTGEQVVLFLEVPPDEPGVFIVSGLASGRLLLTEVQGVLRAVREMEGLTAFRPGAPLRPLGREELGDAREVLARIRRWAGARP